MEFGTSSVWPGDLENCLKERLRDDKGLKIAQQLRTVLAKDGRDVMVAYLVFVNCDIELDGKWFASLVSVLFLKLHFCD